jgi:hypothetical protein
MESWYHKLKYILEETEDIHRFYSGSLGWCFLTDRKGERHRLDDTMTMEEIFNTVEYVKRVNSYNNHVIQKYQHKDRLN